MLQPLPLSSRPLAPMQRYALMCLMLAALLAVAWLRGAPASSLPFANGPAAASAGPVVSGIAPRPLNAGGLSVWNPTVCCATPFQWNNVGNWSTDTTFATPTLPAPGDQLLFPSTFNTFNRLSHNDFASNVIYDSIVISGTIRSLGPPDNFGAAGYIITGNPFSLSNGITDNSVIQFAGGTQVVNAIKPSLLTFTGPAPIQVVTNTVTLTLGNIDLTNNTLTLTGAGSLVLSGSVVNGANIVHSGSGNLTISGPTTATSITNSGTGNVTITGNVTTTTGLTQSGPGTMVVSGVVTGAGGVTVSGGSLQLLNGANTYSGPTTVTAGALTASGPNGLGSSAAGTTVANGASLTVTSGPIAEPLTLNGNGSSPSGGALTVSSIGSVAFSGPITLGSNTRIANNSGFAATVSLNGAIDGAGGLNLTCLTPANDFVLAGANTYAGATTLDCSTTLANAGALGSAAAGTTVASGANLTLRDGISVGDAITYGSGAQLRSTGTGASTLTGPQTLPADLLVTTDAGLTISGAVSGSAGLTKAGTGTLVLSGANSFNGNVAIQQGVLKAQHATALGTAAGGTSVSSGAELQLDGGITVVENLTLNGTGAGTALRSLTGTNTVSGTVSLGSSVGVDVPAGQLTLGGVVSGGNSGLTKTGAGTLVLGANNTYTGPTTVNAGTLIVNGSQPGSAVTLAQGTTLGGGGTTGAVTANGASVSPGQSPGTLTTGALSLSTDISGGPPVFGTLKVEINGTAPGSYDQVSTTGNVVLTTPALSLTVGITPQVGTQFTIINNGSNSPVNGTFYGLPQNGQITVSGVTFQVSYSGGDGNDVVLTVTGSPAGSGVAQGNVRFITPVRVLDTRTAAASGNPQAPIGFDQNGSQIAAARLPADSTTQFRIAGKSFGTAGQGNAITFPANTTGLLGNVTLVQDAPSGGFVTVFPGDQAAPTASTVNPATATAANFWAVGLPTTGVKAGNLAVRSVGAVRDVVIDVVGYYTPDNPSIGNIKFVTPVRVVDTRSAAASGNAASPIGFDENGNQIAAGRLIPNQLRRFTLAGKTFPGLAQAFPADLSGVIAHVTIVQDAASGGFTTLLPGNATGVPSTSTVNPATATAFNSWAVGVPTTGGAGVAGTVGVYSTNSADVIIDIVGYYSPSNPNSVGELSLINPIRALDTRTAGGASDPNAPIGFDENGNSITARQFNAGETRRFTLSGKSFPGGGLPPGLKGVLANITVVQPAASGGFVTAFPGDVPDASRPNVSTVNPATATAASFWANGLPAAGTEAIYSSNLADVLIDVVGYFK